MANKTVIQILSDNNLKVTPQRTAVLEVIMNLKNHPSAETIAEYLKINFPHMPLGTVYKILDKFVQLGIIEKINTNADVARFDAVKEKHHHIYCPEEERIEDYYDDELYNLLDNYLKKKKIPGFVIEDFKLQITGKFQNKQKDKLNKTSKG
jgi:Fur family peroxide stress response transcriptional regulator